MRKSESVMSALMDRFLGNRISSHHSRLSCVVVISGGKMSSSGTRSPLVAIPRMLAMMMIFVNFAMTVEVCFFHDEEAASAMNPLSSDAAQILPMLQNLLLNNDIQRED
ncbi:hypothetical protein Bca52824_007161 [Brassica carinata]|uniref:Uncharacterized protein n=1 Tax=Brassica carinata TaxID=52824 RepID=A0A8X7W9D8_BRACI|nr:hypothetical protein Bca52824_007161 [Brassica carinata]